jgi:redox-sensitive bicupin YhaK (pirin superfamily)
VKRRSKTVAPALGAAVVGMLTAIGSASAADVAVDHTALVSHVVLSDDADTTLVGYQPARIFLAKGAPGGSHVHTGGSHVHTADERFCGFGSYLACTQGVCRQHCY